MANDDPQHNIDPVRSRSPSPIIQSGSTQAEIRSGIDQGISSAPSALNDGGTDGSSSNQMLSTLANILESLSRQQQASMQTNHEFLAGLINRTVAPTRRPRLCDIYIAPYNPDGDVPIRDWCEHVDRAKTHWELADYEVCTKIASLLQGRAKTIGDAWLVKSPVWSEMREALIQTFEPEARYSNDILKLRNFKFDMSNPAESITKAWHIWKRVVSGNKDTHAVEAVIGCMDNEYLRLRLLSSKCTTVPELISVAATIRPQEPRQGEPPAKRPRLRNNREDSIVCFKCGKTGHVQANCNKGNDNVKDPKPLLSENTSKESAFQTERLKLRCNYCNKTGHVEDKCFKKMNDAAERVNLAQELDEILTPMAVCIDNREFTALYDSGAARSLIRRSISCSLPGKREDCSLLLKGIGSSSVPILSCQQINTTCKINSVFVEVTFHIVEDHETPCDLMIGAEIVKGTGLNVLVTEQSAKVMRNSSISTLQEQFSQSGH